MEPPKTRGGRFGKRAQLAGPLIRYCELGRQRRRKLFSPNTWQMMTFLKPSESPNETRRPPYQWSLGAAGGPASPRTVGANGGSTRVPGAKKSFVPKLFLDHLGCSNKCF